MMATPTPAEWLELLIERAPALREAGVAHIEIGDVVVDLHPHYVLQQPDDDDDEPTRAPRDPLEDDATFGGRVPRWRGAES